jgi:hypothetical protein
VHYNDFLGAEWREIAGATAILSDSAAGCLVSGNPRADTRGLLRREKFLFGAYPILHNSMSLNIHK